jgi:ribosomal protein S18 acetylase RimI-like enzyme
MELEPATAADLPELHAMVEAAYRGDSARAGWTHEADLVGGVRTDREELAAMLVDPTQHLLVAREGEHMVGCVALTEKGGGLFYLGMFTVATDRQGGGLGKRLLTAAEDHARRVHATCIEMQVIRQRTELIAWYERRGYRPTGEARPFPYDEPRYTPLRDDLEFVVMQKRL